MPTSSYRNGVPVVHSERGTSGIIVDLGCEVSRGCLTCPLSQCKLDDPDLYRFWRMRAKNLLLGQTIDRERLTNAEAGRRFRVTTRTVQRAKQRLRLAEMTLLPDDIAVFIRLAESDASSLALSEVA